MSGGGGRILREDGTHPMQGYECAATGCHDDGVVVTPEGPMCHDHADELAEEYDG